MHVIVPGIHRFVLAGVGDGITLGTPICIMVPNTDQKSQDYSEMAVAYRPSHADATYDMKYGIRAVSPPASFHHLPQGGPDACFWLMRVQPAARLQCMLQEQQEQYVWHACCPKTPLLMQVAGGGRSSARETIGRVAAGAVAKKLLKTVAGVEVSYCTWLDSVWCTSVASLQ